MTKLQLLAIIIFGLSGDLLGGKFMKWWHVLRMNFHEASARSIAEYLSTGVVDEVAEGDLVWHEQRYHYHKNKLKKCP